MERESIFKNLPTELVFIISNYHPAALISLAGEKKYDWFKLIKMNFGLSYCRDVCSNEEIMKVYLDRCKTEKSRIVYTKDSSSMIRLFDGTLLSCKDNWHDEDRFKNNHDRNIFFEIRKLSGSIANIFYGRYHAMIILTDGRLMSCGLNNYGQLGLGNKKNRSLFFEVGVKNIAQVACGQHHTIIRLMDGTLMGSGSNCFGQLGLGDEEDRKIFTEIKDIVAEDVVCGASHTIIRLRDGTLMSCGLNFDGQLGLGDNKRRVLFEVIKIDKNIVDIVCGANHTFIRSTDGLLMSCGGNFFGQLGHGDYNYRHSFERIPIKERNIAELICCDRQTIIILTDGTLMTCGNGYEQPKKNRYHFEKTASPKNIEELISNFSRTIIKFTDGKLMSSNRIIHPEII
ncbi:MAG: hypothetical protein Hyperionvirus49_4 [Hyperionvirus sp.]|uniref:Chromosome condensation regulator n=1 Tax=Hyperionvirus sp. TaxID=2487770 RepID=A0A3G5ACK7_9VIRU|nr:MAG: hypothetical protein Hyperionvirus49_4 [Hyperionvirus sp.]